jgi:hypothetical protein
MGSRTFGPTSRAKVPVVVPALHALAVTPVVGGIVLLFVAVGFAALAYGACSCFVGHRIAK